jgi:two-component system response regulator AtoC
VGPKRDTRIVSDASGRSELDQAPELELVVHERHERRCLPLPRRGQIVIGRAGDCDLSIEDPSISRRHAILHLRSLELEDVGSKNGSRLFDATGERNENPLDALDGPSQKLEFGKRYPVGLGTVMKLGTVVAYLRKRAPSPHTEPVRSEQNVSESKLVLRDPAMQELYEVALRAAATTVPVLVLGETGVGKDVVASYIHRMSGRHSGPFVRVNCGALSPSLLESEFFGHERGAFTGAADAKAGLLELGNGGTVFLDEIGELPLATQVKLLHVLETGEITRVGGTRAKRVDVRFIAATNRELSREVQAGTFRADLYFRINGVCLKVPPLRERPTELEPLARVFLGRFCRKHGLPEPELTSSALDHLRAYAWPGNIRELKNTMERAALLCGTGRILPAHLPQETELAAPFRSEPSTSFNALGEDEVTTTHVRAKALAAPPYERIADALRRCAGNQTRAAQLLGVSRRTLCNWLDLYALPRPRKGAR